MNPVAVSPEFDFIQRNLIPQESLYVRSSMNQAAKMGARDNFFTSRLYPLPFVVAALALSFFNTLSYLLQIPFEILLDVARFQPLRVLTDPVVGLINVARSFLFVGLAVPLIVSAALFPKDVLSRFAPDAIYAGEERLLRENEQLKKKIEKLKEKREKDLAIIESQAAIIRKSSTTGFRDLLPEVRLPRILRW